MVQYLEIKQKRYCVIELHYLARVSAALKVCGYCIVASNSLNSKLLFLIGKYILLDNKILGQPIILYITMSARTSLMLLYISIKHRSMKYSMTNIITKKLETDFNKYYNNNRKPFYRTYWLLMTAYHAFDVAKVYSYANRKSFWHFLTFIKQ